MFLVTLRANHADEPGNLYVVKFLQGQTGAAALISEVICTSLYRLAGLATLDPVIICAQVGVLQLPTWATLRSRIILCRAIISVQCTEVTLKPVHRLITMT